MGLRETGVGEWSPVFISVILKGLRAVFKVSQEVGNLVADATRGPCTGDGHAALHIPSDRQACQGLLSWGVGCTDMPSTLCFGTHFSAGSGDWKRDFYHQLLGHWDPLQPGLCPLPACPAHRTVQLETKHQESSFGKVSSLGDGAKPVLKFCSGHCNGSE